jgi:tetratricopeptide (TPR) repeat protein
MNQKSLLSLISQGENSTIEFKREINLDSAQQKAEFIKDIIALANSAKETAFMFIGVANEKQLFGIPFLDEERYQEIIQTYINPPLDVICDELDISVETEKVKIGILEVRPSHKPYKVLRTIDRIDQNQVFIRHGSVVAKASPEEIIMMDKETQIRVTASYKLNAAQKHVELGNFQSAVKIYSEIIEIDPEQEWFLERAKAYINLMDSIGQDQSKQIAQLALKDFSDALVLTATSDSEKEVRFTRLRAVHKILSKNAKQGLEKVWQDDVKWLKECVSGQEYGEVLFLETVSQVYDTGHIEWNYYQVLEKAIELGYKDKNLYLIRALIGFLLSNYGFALLDAEKFLETATDPEEKAKALCLKGEMLMRMNMNDFASSYSCFEQARRISTKYLDSHPFSLKLGFPHAVMYGLCMEYEFNNNENNFLRNEGFLTPTLQSLVHFCAAGMSLKEFREFYAPIMATIFDIVGQDFWLSIKWQWAKPQE